MTEQYDTYKNAITERLNGILKQEFAIAKHNVDLKIKSTLIKNGIKI